ncbi:MAG: molybdate ABC transporter substrate-binding protein [Roseivirga sp.]
MAVALLSTTFACHQKKTNTLIIATAANMQFAMAELTETFSKKTGIACEPVLGSSGKLTAQVIAGAPYDIFIAADMKYPQKLYKEGLTIDPPRVFAHGRLVLWSMEQKVLRLPEALTNETLSHIALANPKTAPYGMAAGEVLQHLGIREQLESKLVYGESIAQTNQFITSQAAQVGFTAKSVVLAPSLRNTGTWIDIPLDYYSPLEQGVVILKSKDQPKPEASAFYEFLFSDEAKKILNKFGYSSPPE